MSGGGLWATAACASVALHAVTAIAIYAGLPGPMAPEKPQLLSLLVSVGEADIPEPANMGTSPAKPEPAQLARFDFALAPPSDPPDLPLPVAIDPNENIVRRAAIEAVIDLSQRNLIDGCHAVQVNVGANGAPQVDLFAAQAVDTSAMQTALRQTGDMELRHSPIAAAQCAALAVARQAADYPATGLSIWLDQQLIEDGQNLTGRINGVTEGDLKLLLVEENGRIRDLGPALSDGRAGQAEFALSVALPAGSGMATHLLIALNGPYTLTAGQTADEVFAASADARKTRISLQTVQFR